MESSTKKKRDKRATELQEEDKYLTIVLHKTDKKLQTMIEYM